jgi:hypothetical protein
VEDRPQSFVAAIFRHIKCDWDTLNRAIKEVKLLEWAAHGEQALQRSDSMTKSASIDSNISNSKSMKTVREGWI